MVDDEKRKHENEVKVILGLVNNPPESLGEFFNDTNERLINIEGQILEIEDLIKASTLKSNDELFNEILRDLHTIKGNAASFGFEELSIGSHELEEIVLQAKEGALSFDLTRLQEAKSLLIRIKNEKRRILDVSKNLNSSDFETIQVLETKVNSIESYSEKILHSNNFEDPNSLKKLANACVRIRHLPIEKLFKKYENTIYTYATEFNKRIKVELIEPDLEINPLFFKQFNEPLLHILRNSLHHGIEDPEHRIAIKKDPVGIIQFSITSNLSTVFISLSDDGRGVDLEKVCQSALDKNLISSQELSSMSDKEKLDLVFLPSFSTETKVNSIAGRGVGLDSVRSSLNKINASIKIETKLNYGTKFTIEIPNENVLNVN